jgi:hypothetical protein
MARPKKWNDERRAKIVALIAKGVTRKGAARAAGISEGKLYEEMKRNAEFREAIHGADAKSEEVLVDFALEGAKKDGRVALMMLERRHKEWAKAQSINTLQHQHMHAMLPTEMIARLAQMRRNLDYGITLIPEKGSIQRDSSDQCVLAVTPLGEQCPDTIAQDIDDGHQEGQ